MPELTLRDRLATRLVRQFPGQRIDIVPRRPIVSFSFDDVPETALSNGARVLEAHGVRGTFYIAGGLAGRVEAGRRIAGPEAAGELARRGHEVGSHTFAHRTVASYLPAGFAADLDRNDAYLEGIEARNFAFPFTVSSPLVRPELQMRFRTSRGGDPGINRGQTDRSFLRAVEIRSDSAAADLDRWVDDVAHTPGWLIFFTHDVSDEPTLFGCTPERLEALVVHAVASGCEVLTVDAALERMGLAAAIDATRRRR